MPLPSTELFLNDLIQTRKPHPCGGDTWRVVRLGADIGIRCERCGRNLLLPRTALVRHIRSFVARGSDGQTG
jgi:hypothetical protein